MATNESINDGKNAKEGIETIESELNNNQTTTTTSNIENKIVPIESCYLILKFFSRLGVEKETFQTKVIDYFILTLVIVLTIINSLQSQEIGIHIG